MEYQSNSHKSKREAENNDRVKKETIAKGKLIKKKKGTLEKIVSAFVNEDVENVKEYAITDVLVPSVKKAIYDIFSNGLHMFLYGEVSDDDSSRSGKYRSYNKMYKSESEEKKKKKYDFNDIILDSKGDAEDVLSKMIDTLEEYGMVSVSDFYDFVGVDSSYTDNKWGWTDLRTASTIRDSKGYKIKLPRAIPLD